MSISNKARQQNPRRNHWSWPTAGSRNGPIDNSVPAFNVTAEIATAAALVAKHNARNASMAASAAKVEAQSRAALEEAKSRRQALLGGQTQKKMRRSTDDSYWMDTLDNLGTQPFGSNSSYKVRVLGATTWYSVSLTRAPGLPQRQGLRGCR